MLWKINIIFTLYSFRVHRLVPKIGISMIVLTNEAPPKCNRLLWDIRLFWPKTKQKKVKQKNKKFYTEWWSCYREFIEMCDPPLLSGWFERLTVSVIVLFLGSTGMCFTSGCAAIPQCGRNGKLSLLYLQPPFSELNNWIPYRGCH